MINRLISLVRRPERGWDPVPPHYASHYSASTDPAEAERLVDSIEEQVGSLRGLRVLDLGGGPGAHACAFARRGARVTWHDVSRNYMALARTRAREQHLIIDFSLGYLEEARRFSEHPFDLVFNKVCWNYAMDDRAFARLLHDLARPGGTVVVLSDTLESARQRWKMSADWRARLNKYLWIKVGHPYPPLGRITSLMAGLPFAQLSARVRHDDVEMVFFTRRGGAAQRGMAAHRDERAAG